MYRMPGEVPMYPVEETNEQRVARTNREIEFAKQKKRRRDAIAALFLAGFPSVSLMVVGFEWSHMTAAVAITSIITIVIASFGVFVATVISLDW
jgi:uncharacterized membrane protein (DUF485 family)